MGALPGAGRARTREAVRHGGRRRRQATRGWHGGGGKVRPACCGPVIVWRNLECGVREAAGGNADPAVVPDGSGFPSSDLPSLHMEMPPVANRWRTCLQGGWQGW